VVYLVTVGLLCLLVTVGLLCLLSLVLNAIVLNLNDRDVYFQKDMPKWVKINASIYPKKI